MGENSNNTKMTLNITCGVIKNPTTKIVGMCSLEIGGFIVLNNIKIVEGEKGYFLGMPSVKTKDDKYKDLFYFKNEKTREYITSKVLEEFTKKLENTEIIEIEGEIPF